MDKINYTNNNCFNLLGYQKKEIIDASINLLIPPNFRNNHINLMKRIT